MYTQQSLLKLHLTLDCCSCRRAVALPITFRSQRLPLLVPLVYHYHR